jgi:molybdopterin molybdotransferase
MEERNPLISLDAAVARLTAMVAPPAGETVPVSLGLGRVLAEPVAAAFDQPPFASSAMDGWAVRAADLAGACPENPIELRQIAEIPAGKPFAGTLGPGEAARIFTGGALPAGADAVVMQEDAAATASGGLFTRPAAPGRHIRPMGQDFAAGQVLIAAGERLSAGGVGLAAAAGGVWLSVRRRPRVGVLATGDEIALPGTALKPGGIISSNAFALAALVEGWGGVPVHLGVAGDDRGAVEAALNRAQGLDLLLVSGGGGGGAYDVMAQIGAEAGWENRRLALRPCRAVTIGRIGSCVVLGLPGNPVPAFVGALLLAEPMLRAMSGDPPPRRLAVRVDAALEPTGDLTVAHLACLGRKGSATTAELSGGKGGGGGLRATAFADALIIRPPGAPAAAPGALAEAILIHA